MIENDTAGDWGAAFERRSNERQIACYPADVRAGDENVLAVIRDISMTGALLFTQEEQQAEAPLSLILHPEEDGSNAIPVGARVVRCTRRLSGGLWRYSVAVAFDEPIEAHRAFVAEMLRRLPPIPVGDV